MLQLPIDSVGSEAICAPIDIKTVYFSVSYQQAIYYKYIVGVAVSRLVGMGLYALKTSYSQRTA